MEVAVITVGDELLAGDVENTNATWLCRQLAARGATAARVVVVPDDAAVLADYVRRWRDAFDAVVVTGGLGGTHDDVTVDAVADALDRPLVLTDAARTAVAEYDVDPAAWASLPEGARLVDNAEGLSPGCAVDGVYVFPGVPSEMRAMFRSVADEFAGDAVAETRHTPASESSLTDVLADARDRFDGVAVGSYPQTDAPNRIKVSGTDPDAVADAVAWIEDRVETVDSE